MKSIKFMAVAVFSLFSLNVLGGQCAQNNNELSFLGMVDGQGMLYAQLNSTTNECSCSVVRFKTENTDTKMVLSILLAARMSSNKVRVDLLDSTDCDSAYKVYIQ